MAVACQPKFFKLLFLFCFSFLLPVGLSIAAGAGETVDKLSMYLARLIQTACGNHQEEMPQASALISTAVAVATARDVHFEFIVFDRMSFQFGQAVGLGNIVPPTFYPCPDLPVHLIQHARKRAGQPI